MTPFFLLIVLKTQITMRNNFKGLKFDIDTSRLFRFQAPIMPHRDTSQQFVVGNIIDDELWLLTDDYPPQIAPISDFNERFQVFVLGENSDMNSLISVWRHSSRFHETTLQIFSLKDLGIDSLPKN